MDLVDWSVCRLNLICDFLSDKTAFPVWQVEDSRLLKVAQVLCQVQGDDYLGNW